MKTWLKWLIGILAFVILILLVYFLIKRYYIIDINQDSIGNNSEFMLSQRIAECEDIEILNYNYCSGFGVNQECEEREKSLNRDSCYRSLAIDFKDLEICNFIQDKDTEGRIKNYCIKEVEDAIYRDGFSINGFTEENFTEALKPGIAELCSYFDSKRITSSCADCQVNNYELVNSLEGYFPDRSVWYTIEETDEGYFLQTRVYTIYGRNTYMGSKRANFTLDENLNIIDKEFPILTCTIDVYHSMCAQDFYDCEDFETQEKAQEFFDFCLAAMGGDVYNIDSNGNGIPCEEDDI